jgi:hypothetical protein
MDGPMLVRHAPDAGLAVAAEVDKLVIRGPKRSGSVARLLIEHKRDVLPALYPTERAAQRWRNRYAARISHWFLHGRRHTRSRGARLLRDVERMAHAVRSALVAVVVCRVR